MKTIHINKSPMVVRNLKTLTPDMAQRWGLDVDACLQHALVARDLPDMSALWKQVYAPTAAAAGAAVLAEQNLYGGFVGPQDRRRLQQLRDLLPQELAVDNTGFDDPRLPELVFRWRARNWPDSLRPDEQQRWQQHCAQVLLHGLGGARTAEQLSAEIDALSENVDEAGEDILGALYDWVEMVMPEE